MDVNLEIHKHSITALIGPSGLRQVHLPPLPQPDERPGAEREGRRQGPLPRRRPLRLRRRPVEVRRRIGMVFQRPNPFPKSIYDNVAYGLGSRHEGPPRRPRRAGAQGAALWDEVKNRLKQSALGLSGGQQQRLCIARAIAVEPDVILLDEPASALDPISTSAIEDLMHELKREYTLVIVTHNMQQAARVAEMTAFFSLDVKDDGSRNGILVEYDATEKIFTAARRRTDRGLRHGTLRLACGSRSPKSCAARGVAPGGGRPRPARAALGAERSRPRRRGARRRGDQLRRRGRPRATSRSRRACSRCSRGRPRSPSDLRLVLAVLRVNLHLERMADYCVTVAKLTKLMGGLNVTDDAIAESIEDMGQRAEQMIRVALDSFAARDPEKALTLVELDELIDRANRQRDRGRPLARRLGRGARVRPAHARRLALRRADRRPRRRHRRAGRLPRHRRVPRVQRRLASDA